MFLCWKKARKGSYVWDGVSAEWKVYYLPVIEKEEEDSKVHLYSVSWREVNLAPLPNHKDLGGTVSKMEGGRTD